MVYIQLIFCHQGFSTPSPHYLHLLEAICNHSVFNDIDWVTFNSDWTPKSEATDDQQREGTLEVTVNINVNYV